MMSPLGATVEWTAEIVEDRPNEVIAWRSIEGTVPNSGTVRFVRAPGDRGTEVRLQLSYDPPAGAIGAAIAKLFGEEPSQQVDGDLRRLKQVLEHDEQIFHAVKQVIIASLHGHPQPLVAESARSGLSDSVRPGLTELLDSLRGR